MTTTLMTAPGADAAQAFVAPVQPPADWLRVIRAEYGEMPGLSLTRAQAARLWSLAAAEADAALRELECAGFLRCNRTGRYVRMDVCQD